MLKKTYLLIIGLMLLSTNLFASHYMGGEITWECLPNGNYRFIMKAYRECAGISYPAPTLDLATTVPNLSSIVMTLVSKTDISPKCYDPVQEIRCYPNPSASNTGAVEEWFYTSDTIYPNGVPLNGIPPPEGWEFHYSSNARNPNVNLTSNGSFRLRAIMYPYNNRNVYPCFDNSPKFEENPAVILALGYPFTYNQLAFDKERDSLAYKWGQPLYSDGSPIPFAPGYGVSSPLPDTSLQFPNNVPATVNPHTGEVSFECYGPQGAYVTVLKVEAWRYGVKVAEIFRDLQVVLRPIQPANNLPVVKAPFINPATGQRTDYIDTVYAGDLVQFNIMATDSGYLPTFPSTPQTLSYSALGIQFGANYTDSATGCSNPPCATLSPPPPDSSLFNLSTSFNWQTAYNHLITDSMGKKRACTYNFGFKIQDNYCPIPGMTSKTVTIVVEPPPLDAGVISIVEPYTQTIIGDSMTVKVLVKNHGILDITALDLKYTINGTDTVAEVWTGLLKPDSVMQYTFASEFISPSGPYQLCAYIRLAGDIDPANDATCTQNTGLPSFYDSGVMSIVEPNTHTITGDSMAVTVLVKNFGTLDVTAFDLNYTINGTDKVAEVWTGLLKPCSTMQYTFVTGYISPSGPYQLCAYTVLAGDTNPVNDINCAQHTGLSPFYDAGVTTITEPTGKQHLAGDSLTVTVLVKNFGTFDITTLDLNYMINGTDTVTEAWTGLLKPGSIMQYTFITRYASPSGSCQLCAYTGFAGDIDPANDTTCIQYTGLIPFYDAGVISITEPVGTQHLISDSLTVTVLVKNFGTLDITALDLNYTINGIDIVTETWTGMLKPDSATQYTFVTGYISPSGSYQLCTYANLVGDAEPTNDTICAQHTGLLPFYDAGTIKITEPSGVPHLAGNNLTVTVLVKNFGTLDITTLNLNYTINGTGTVTEMWTGLLKPDSTMQYTFTTGYVTPLGIYQLCVYTGLAGDVDPANDTYCAQHTGLPPFYDAAIMSIIEPNAQTIITDSIQVTVLVKNFGTLDITALDLNYMIDGADKVAETWTGHLKPDSAMQYTFASEYISPSGLYQLCAYIRLTGDVNPTNDTVCAQHTGVPPFYDVGVISIVEPVDTQIIIIGNSMTVKVLLKNFGIIDLDSFDLEYNINGVVKASESWTGLLRPDSIQEYIFATQYFSPAGLYQLCAYTILTGEADTTNNESCNTILSVGIDEIDKKEFVLGQNKPNPTGDKTRIEYYVPVPDKAVFKLKNSLGQQVLMYEEKATAGPNAIEINVSKLPAGLYYYSVEYKGERLSKKLIISR